MISWKITIPQQRITFGSTAAISEGTRTCVGGYTQAEGRADGIMGGIPKFSRITNSQVTSDFLGGVTTEIYAEDISSWNSGRTVNGVPATPTTGTMGDLSSCATFTTLAPTYERTLVSTKSFSTFPITGESWYTQTDEFFGVILTSSVATVDTGTVTESFMDVDTFNKTTSEGSRTAFTTLTTSSTVTGETTTISSSMSYQADFYDYATVYSAQPGDWMFTRRAQPNSGLTVETIGNITDVYTSFTDRITVAPSHPTASLDSPTLDGGTYHPYKGTSDTVYLPLWISAGNVSETVVIGGNVIPQATSVNTARTTQQSSGFSLGTTSSLKAGQAVDTDVSIWFRGSTSIETFVGEGSFTTEVVTILVNGKTVTAPQAVMTTYVGSQVAVSAGNNLDNNTGNTWAPFPSLIEATTKNYRGLTQIEAGFKPNLFHTPNKMQLSDPFFTRLTTPGTSFRDGDLGDSYTGDITNKSMNRAHGEAGNAVNVLMGYGLKSYAETSGTRKKTFLADWNLNSYTVTIQSSQSNSLGTSTVTTSESGIVSGDSVTDTKSLFTEWEMVMVGTTKGYGPETSATVNTLGDVYGGIGMLTNNTTIKIDAGAVQISDGTSSSDVIRSLSQSFTAKSSVILAEQTVPWAVLQPQVGDGNPGDNFQFVIFPITAQ